jgi:squalene-hopene/tetraprenyl-beta-curcumene cyclase
MPFDRSGVDLTAHALRAIYKTHNVRLESLTYKEQRRAQSAIRRGLRYLERQQRADGSFVPLWFGNQYHPAEENPVYGTARVLLAYRDLGLIAGEPACRALRWLVEHVGGDGGWGGSTGTFGQPGGMSSVEETAVAVEALSAAEIGLVPPTVTTRGIDWLIRAVETGGHREPAPIGLYFARLWYYERLYPLVFLVSALGQAMRRWLPEAGQHANTPALKSRE